ncbi:MAG: glycerophosphodiester phosphodiesterase [Parcubacteria group bacterium]
MILKIGHRGAAGHEPENTMVSFQRAVEMGAGAIELDVRPTRDNQVMIMHDSTVDRTTNGHGKVSQLSLSDVRILRTKEKSQPIPTLSEVLDAYQDNMEIFIEIKDFSCVTPLADLLLKRNNFRNIVVISFSRRTLESFSAHMPNIDVGRTFIVPPFALPFFTQRFIIPGARILNAQWVNLFYPMITQSLVTSLHKNGFKVNAWTVDAPKNIERMKRCDVDGIISNFLDRL